MKYTNQERVDIGQRIYDGEITRSWFVYFMVNLLFTPGLMLSGDAYGVASIIHPVSRNYPLCVQF